MTLREKVIEAILDKYEEEYKLVNEVKENLKGEHLALNLPPPLKGCMYHMDMLKKEII